MFCGMILAYEVMSSRIAQLQGWSRIAQLQKVDVWDILL